MVVLTDNDRVALEGHNSKGAQIKFKKDNIWYKIDNLGYEGLSEVIVSNILQRSNIEDFVTYKEEEIEYKGRRYLGCKSENFKPEGAEIVTITKLFQQYYGADNVVERCLEDTLEDTIYHCLTFPITKVRGF